MILLRLPYPPASQRFFPSPFFLNISLRLSFSSYPNFQAKRKNSFISLDDPSNATSSPPALGPPALGSPSSSLNSPCDSSPALSSLSSPSPNIDSPVLSSSLVFPTLYGSSSGGGRGAGAGAGAGGGEGGRCYFASSASPAPSAPLTEKEKVKIQHEQEYDILKKALSTSPQSSYLSPPLKSNSQPPPPTRSYSNIPSSASPKNNRTSPLRSSASQVYTPSPRRSPSRGPIRSPSQSNLNNSPSLLAMKGGGGASPTRSPPRSPPRSPSQSFIRSPIHRFDFFIFFFWFLEFFEKYW